MEQPNEPKIDGKIALAALERFVVENDELLELEARIGRFNIFDALRIEPLESVANQRSEVSHCG